MFELRFVMIYDAYTLQTNLTVSVKPSQMGMFPSTPVNSWTLQRPLSIATESRAPSCILMWWSRGVIRAYENCMNRGFAVSYDGFSRFLVDTWRRNGFVEGDPRCLPSIQTLRKSLSGVFMAHSVRGGLLNFERY
jgi:hypothetical protein